MKDESKTIIIKEFFDRGIWRLIWKNAVLSVYAGAWDAVICVLSVIATYKTAVFRQRDSFTRAKCLEFARRN
jgi:hypothetical protein